MNRYCIIPFKEYPREGKLVSNDREQVGDWLWAAPVRDGQEGGSKKETSWNNGYLLVWLWCYFLGHIHIKTSTVLLK